MKSSTSPLFRHQDENLLMTYPIRVTDIAWERHADGSITLRVAPHGLLGQLVSRWSREPSQAYRLDPVAGRVWELSDGTRTVMEIGKLLYSEFGEREEPIAERVAKEVLGLKRRHALAIKGIFNEK